MTRERAIDALDMAAAWNGCGRATSAEVKEALYMAKAALREQEERSKGCEYCRGKEMLYQYTNATKLYINTFGKARTLVTECIPCPPYSDCSMRGVPSRSAFIIKFCPECGRKLEVEE